MSNEYLNFPDPNMADENGLLCYGGNLKPESLILAYSKGIFPWYDKSAPILWWSPPQRMIMKPDDLKISKSMRLIINKNIFEITFDTRFNEVIHACATQNRAMQDDTWITKEMEAAYTKLHQLGFAHSVEAYYNGELAGGLYGVSLGKAFFGESMFYNVSNASKVAFFALVRQLKAWDFHFIDCQQNTKHLQSLGAYEISRKDFLTRLDNALKYETKRGKWVQAYI